MVKDVDFQGMGVFDGDVGQLVQWGWSIVVFNNNFVQQVWRSMICVNFVDLVFECFDVFFYVDFSIFFDIVNYVMNF